MIALAFLLGGIVAAHTAILVWLVYRAIAAADHAADSRVAQSDTEAHLERAQYELEVTTQALHAANARADALEKVIADDVARNPNADLARTDVHARLLRFIADSRPAAEGRTSADAAADLHSDAPAVSPRSAELPAGSATVR